MINNSEKLHIRFLQYNESLHLFQLYTGFSLLENFGVLKCHFDKFDNYNFNLYGNKILALIINDEIKVAYDTEDHEIVDLPLLDWCDFYFKRSYKKGTHQSQSHKIMPLGFNYLVYAPNMGLYRRVKRNYKNRSVLSKEFIKLICMNDPIISRLFSYNLVISLISTKILNINQFHENNQ